MLYNGVNRIIKEGQYKIKQKNKQWYTKHYIERKRSNNTWRLGVNSGASGLQAVPAPLVAPFVLLLLQIANECCVLSSHLFLIWFVCFCWSDRSCYPIFVEVTDRAIQSLLKWQIVLSNLCWSDRSYYPIFHCVIYLLTLIFYPHVENTCMTP
jgi:hypothetical protein